MANRDEFDVCVIGTGAGVMIQELTAACGHPTPEPSLPIPTRESLR
jgi:hypothetical protein